MKKYDFPPILPHGIHARTLIEFKDQFVTAFPDDAVRLRLYLLLSEWVQRIQAAQLKAILWLDGSFVTSKFEPGDIDCTIWIPHPPPILSTEQEVALSELLDHDAVKATFGLDLYMEAPRPEKQMHREAYWRGLYGFQHDGKSAKGFVEIAI